MHYVQKWANDLAGQRLPFKIHAKDDEHGLVPGDYAIPLEVQEVKLWSFRFPETSKDLVLSTLLPGNCGNLINPKFEKFKWFIKKALGLKDVPKFDRKARIGIEPPAGTEVVCLGIKEDGYFKDGTERL